MTSRSVSNNNSVSCQVETWTFSLTLLRTLTRKQRFLHSLQLQRSPCNERFILTVFFLNSSRLAVFRSSRRSSHNRKKLPSVPNAVLICIAYFWNRENNKRSVAISMVCYNTLIARVSCHEKESHEICLLRKSL